MELEKFSTFGATFGARFEVFLVVRLHSKYSTGVFFREMLKILFFEFVFLVNVCLEYKIFLGNNKLQYILSYIIMERKSIQIQYKKPSAKKGSPQNTRNHIWVAPSKQVVP